MQTDTAYRFKLPVLHWLFLAFLSSCISYQTNDSQSVRQLAPIEAVHSFGADFRSAGSVDYFSGISFPAFQPRSRNFSIQKTGLLSQKIGRSVISTTRFLRFRSLPRNIALHSRTRNLHSNISEDPIS